MHKTKGTPGSRKTHPDEVIRMCCICRQHLPKKDLHAYMKGADGRWISARGSACAGRKQYVCGLADCQSKAKKAWNGILDI